LSLFARISCTSNYSFGWHAYDYSKLQNEGCENLTNSHISTNLKEIVTKYKLWPGHLQDREVTSDNILYGIDIAMQTIWDHQHPINCSNSKFLISGYWEYGFGSTVHIEGAALSLAMNLGRVYLQNPIMFPSKNWQVKSIFCRSQLKSNLECYYHPWSSCTIFDALGLDAFRILEKRERDRKRNLHFDPLKSFDVTKDEIMNNSRKSIIESLIEKYKSDKTLIHGTVDMDFLGHVIPFSLVEVVNCSPMRQDFTIYWWRAIAATYMLRPNNLTLEWLYKNRPKRFHHTDNSINIYIRRGDKTLDEMKSVTSDAYISAANIIWRDKLISKVNGENITHHKIFFESEDASANLEVEALSKLCSWEFFNTTFYDRSIHQSKLKANNHHELEYLGMIHTLDTAMISSGWVCTLASNVCRLIDELRTTIAGKLRYPYADLSEETCTNVPCIGSNISNFIW
jgi:hypothetical protein